MPSIAALVKNTPRAIYTCFKDHALMSKRVFAVHMRQHVLLISIEGFERRFADISNAFDEMLNIGRVQIA